jgi:hypothetical protein
MQTKSVLIQDNWQKVGALVWKILRKGNFCRRSLLKGLRGGQQTSFSRHSFGNFRSTCYRNHINTTLFVLSWIFDKKVGKRYTPVERSTNADSYHKRKNAVDSLHSRGQMFTSRIWSEDFVQATPIGDSTGNMRSYTRKSKISPTI